MEESIKRERGLFGLSGFEKDIENIHEKAMNNGKEMDKEIESSRKSMEEPFQSATGQTNPLINRIKEDIESQKDLTDNLKRREEQQEEQRQEQKQEEQLKESNIPKLKP